MLVVGAAYKPGVRDVREAPAVRIMHELAEEGVEVSYHDPLVRSLEVDEHLARLSVPHPLPSDYDLALVVTIHEGHDYGWLDEFDQVLDCTYQTPLGRDEGTDLVTGLSTAGRLRTREPIPWFNLALRAVCALYLAVIVTAVLAYKTVFIEIVVEDPWFGVYSVVVCAYIMSRFLFSLFYRPVPLTTGVSLEPTIAVVMPAFNEEDAVADSIGSLLTVDYPPEKLEIVVIDDGSTDDTLREIERVAAGSGSVRVISFPENRGKRAAMAAGIRATSAAIVAFVDSDSSLERDALRRIVRGFAEPEGGRDRRSCRGAELARVVDRAHAGGAVLRRVPRLQGGGVDLRRGHVLLGLLLRLPPRGHRPRARALGEPALPRAPGNLR